MNPSDRRPPRGERGLVLLEVLIALVIFTTVVLAWSRLADSALEAAATANQERTLRMLAARKLAEIRAKPAEMKDGGEGGFEEEFGEDSGEAFLDYRWKVEAKEVLAAGWADDGETEFLFPRDEQAGKPEPAAPGGKTPDAIRRLRLRLTVSHQPQGTEGEEFRVVTFVPAAKKEGEGEAR